MLMKTCNDRKKKGLFNIRTKFSYYKVLHWKGVGYRNKKTKKYINEPATLELLILELSKWSVYEFLYGYAKSKYGEKSKFCYTDTDNIIVYIKTDDIYKDIPEDVEKRFDTSNYELDRPLPQGKHKNIIGLMKDELGEK